MLKSEFQERKKERTDYYMKNIYGWRIRSCTACNGSGYYDHFRSPMCKSCDGTGKEKYKGPKNKC